MIQHENSNIQIIANKLWAVRFSLIPWIPQLSVTGVKDLPSMPFALDDSGVVLLNLEHKGYSMIRKELKKIMPMNRRKIDKEIQKISRFPNPRPEQLFRLLCLRVELARKICFEGTVK